MKLKQSEILILSVIFTLLVIGILFLISAVKSKDLNALVLDIKPTNTQSTLPVVQFQPPVEVPVSEQPVQAISTEIPDPGIGMLEIVDPPPSPVPPPPSEPQEESINAPAVEAPSSTSPSSTSSSSSEPRDGFGSESTGTTSSSSSGSTQTENTTSSASSTSTYTPTKRTYTPYVPVPVSGETEIEEDGFFEFEIEGDPYTDGLQGSSKDTDGEGLYDNLEYLYGTDYLNVDTDGDSFSDGREVLDYRTDPLNEEDPVSLDDLGINITSFDEGQTVADLQPLIKGVGPAGYELEIWAQMIGGNNMHLGNVVSDQDYIFIFRPDVVLEEGEYEFSADIKDKSEYEEGEELNDDLKTDALGADLSYKKPLPKKVPRKKKKVRLVAPVNMELPQPERLAVEKISENVLLNDIRVEIEDEKPVLYGNVNFLYQVKATWKSLVLTSALIADSPAGEFEIEPPKKLGFGDHEVYVQAIRPKDNVLSEAVKVSFNIKEQLHVKDDELKSSAVAEDEKIIENGSSMGYLLGLGFIGLAGLISLFFLKKRIKK